MPANHITRSWVGIILAFVLGVFILFKAQTAETITTSPHAATSGAADYIALVTNGADGTVSVVDIDSGAVIQTITVGDPQSGDAPGCIVLTPDESLALVTYNRDSFHRVIALDTAAIADGIDGNEVIDTIYLNQTGPEDGSCIAVTPDGTRVYVAGGDGNFVDVAVIEIAAIADGIPNNEVTWIDTGAAFFESIVITHDGSRAYATSDGYWDQVTVFDTNPANPGYNTIIDGVEIGPVPPTSSPNSNAKGIALTPDGTRAYIADGVFRDVVYVVDVDPASPTYHTQLAMIPLDPIGKRASRIALTPDGRRAYVTRFGEVAIIDTHPGSATYNTMIDTITGIPAGDGGIAVTSDGETLLVVNNGSDSLSIVRTADNSEVARVPVGDSPVGVAIYRAPVPADHVKVVNEAGVPVKNAFVYRNGLLAGASDDRGIVVPETMQAGDHFVGVSMIHEQPTSRVAHQTSGSSQNWAYRIYTTSLNQDVGGEPIPHTVTALGQQVITITQSSPLVLFNLVVAIEWDANDVYLDEISRAAGYASDFLYDFTDGQMALGPVAIYDNGVNWADADIQVSARNIVHPHAFVGGLTSNDTSHVVRLGRGWDGSSGNQGAWDGSAGYRTLAHEFAHYALYLFDEYFGYQFDQNGNLVGDLPAYCTGLENRNPTTEAANASVMDYQYTTSELSMQGVPGLWSSLCQQTAQWQLHGESAWETLIRKYGDTAVPPRWQFTTPADRGGILLGPTSLPDHVLNFPLVEVHQAGTSPPTRQLTVYGPDGPYRQSIVALYVQGGPVIDQGFTDSNGRLTIYGAHEGDTIRTASIDGGLSGSITVESEDLIITFGAPNGMSLQSAGGIPHVRLVPFANPDPDQVDLLIFLENFGAGADPAVVINEPDSETGHAPAMHYNDDSSAYEGQITFSATERGMGYIRAFGAGSSSVIRLQTTYRLQHVSNNQEQVLYANDGNLSLYLDPGSLPGNEAYFVIMSPGAIPGPLPAGLTLIGDAYAVTASGALLALEKPAILTLRYDRALGNLVAAPEGLAIYRWRSDQQVWEEVPGELDEDHKVMVASVAALDTYALLAPSGSWEGPNEVFLPVVHR